MFKNASRIGVCGLAASAVFVGVQQTEAAALPGEFGTAIPGFFGTETFSDSFFGFTVNAEVNYAVFAPNAVQTITVGPVNSYLYAYEIINFDSAVTKLTVGLDGDEPLGAIGDNNDPGAVAPTASAFIGAGPTSAAWDFTAPNTLPNGATSRILWFTSDAAPEFDLGTVAADWSATRELPSPLPEPATLGLMALGLVAIGTRRGR